MVFFRFNQWFFICKLALVSYKTAVFLPSLSVFFPPRLSITVESQIIFIIQCLIKCYFVLVLLDCCKQNTIDWVAWTANTYFSQSGGREGQGQGLGRFSSWRALSSWFADVCFLTVLTWWRERFSIFLFLERTDPILRAPPLQPHLNLITANGPTFKHHHLGFRASVSGRDQHSDGRSFPCS